MQVSGSRILTLSRIFNALEGSPVHPLWLVEGIVGDTCSA